MDKRILTQLEIFQRQEATMAILYKKLSKVIKDPYNRDIMEKLSEKEVQHYENAKAITGVSCKPYRYKIWGFFLIVRLFGLTFGVKLLENNGKEMAQLTDELSQIPELNIITEGVKNEKILIEKIEE